eukprot:2706922-Pyramimonas_sp.AAC.1
MDDRVLSEVHIGTPPQANTWRTDFYIRAAHERVGLLSLLSPEVSDSDTESEVGVHVRDGIPSAPSVDLEGDLVLRRRRR